MCAETINVLFSQADGGVSTGLYSGIVKVRVSGTGYSLGLERNDAFYLTSGQTHDPSYYQLTFGTQTLVGFSPARNAVNFVVGGLPDYQANHVYDFMLDTGTLVPTQLHFGVGDGIYNDNEGAFVVSLGVPEPAAWAMMVGGFGAVGGAVRRRRRRDVRVTFA